MKLHPTREATRADIDQIAVACGGAQAEFWTGIRRPIEWTDEVKQRVMERLYTVVAVDGAVVRGVLLLKIRPPTVEIIGLTTPQILAKERVGMALSMLIGGYKPCADAGVMRGYGNFVAPNKIILDTLALVDTFKVELRGTAPSPATVSKADRVPHTYQAETEIGPAYLAALEAALEAL